MAAHCDHSRKHPPRPPRRWLRGPALSSWKKSQHHCPSATTHVRPEEDCEDDARTLKAKYRDVQSSVAILFEEFFRGCRARPANWSTNKDSYTRSPLLNRTCDPYPLSAKVACREQAPQTSRKPVTSETTGSPSKQDVKQGLYFLYPQKDTRYIHSPILKRSLIYTHQKKKYKPCFMSILFSALRTLRIFRPLRPGRNPEPLEPRGADA